MNTKRLMVLIAGALLATTTHASAQMREWTGRGFLSVNGGIQGGSQEFAERITFPIYDEQAVFEGRHNVAGGGLFDISAGVRVWRNLAIGIGVTRFQDKDDVTLTGSVPHPIFFNRPRSVTTQLGALKHQETAVHVQAVWVMPLLDKIDLALSLGPSFFSVKQDVVTGIDLREGDPPFGAASATARGRELEDSTVGFNIGADFTYLVTPTIGGGFFLRYAGGSADLTGDSGSFSLDVGGFQAGGGVRVRF